MATDPMIDKPRDFGPLARCRRHSAWENCQGSRSDCLLELQPYDPPRAEWVTDGD
jgi:hypothetical protein